MSFHKFKERLVKIEFNEENMFKFEEAFETFITSLFAYCSFKITLSERLATIKVDVSKRIVCVVDKPEVRVSLSLKLV